MTAIAERRDDLADLVGNANATTGAIAAENRALSEALALLPTTLRRGNSTFVNLRATLDDLDPLVAESKPATKDLAPFLRELRPLVRDAKPTIADLSNARPPARRRQRPGRGHAQAAGLPEASPARRSRAAPSALQKGQPVLEFARPYIPELVGWFRDFGVGAGQLRRQRPLRAHPADLQRLPARRAARSARRSSSRCPSRSASTACRPACCAAARAPPASRPPDGSAPYRDSGGNLDCDPTQVVAGP